MLFKNKNSNIPFGMLQNFYIQCKKIVDLSILHLLLLDKDAKLNYSSRHIEKN